MWFERWFGEAYKALYPHRDEVQADRQVQSLIENAGATPAWRVLDLGCGSGRHLRSFYLRKFTRTVGLDLSRVLLRDARAFGPTTQADMRRLPFADATFDLVACFFTSFGYFVTFEEDVAVLKEFRRVVRPGGMLFLDLNNPEHVRCHLVSHDRQLLDGKTVEQDRFLEGDVVVKRIRIAYGDHEERFEERVRLFPLSRLEPVFSDLGFTIAAAFGDECGNPFVPKTSPRMGLLLRRNPT